MFMEVRHGFANVVTVQGLVRPALLRCQQLSSSADDQQDNTNDVKIPEHVERYGETVEVIRARLQYQSRKRGTLENGLLLR